MRQYPLTDVQKRELHRELIGVRAQATEIDNSSQSDESMQRVVMTLPKSLICMAQFIAIMETRRMPDALAFWRYISGEGSDDDVPARNAKRIMRAWMAEEIMRRTHVAMLEMQAESEDRR